MKFNSFVKNLKKKKGKFLSKFKKLRFHNYLSSERDYELLDHIVARLKFFQRFNDTLRKKVLENSILIKKKASEILFTEGDYGDLMYIIIKGSVSIKVRRNYESYAKGNYEVVINSFYDGDHFGDLAMMSSRKKSISKRTLRENTNKVIISP